MMNERESSSPRAQMLAGLAEFDLMLGRLADAIPTASSSRERLKGLRQLPALARDDDELGRSVAAVSQLETILGQIVDLARPLAGLRDAFAILRERIASGEIDVVDGTDSN